MTAQCFDLADRLQTVVMLISDLDLGMNNHMSNPLKWKEDATYDLGKVLGADELEEMTETFGRYLDTDGDGIPYRTIPGTHPTKGSFFTRGTSHNEYAKYSESGEDYVRKVDRLSLKWETAKSLMPASRLFQDTNQSKKGLMFFGSTSYAAKEAIDLLKKNGIALDAIQVKSFPFHKDVKAFIDDHSEIMVVEQSRDAQFRTLLINELEVNPEKITSVLDYSGTPITADKIIEQILNHLANN